MKISQFKFSEEVGWEVITEAQHTPNKPRLIFMFADRLVMEKRQCCSALMKKFPDDTIISCSTAGDILQEEVLDSQATATIIEFEKAHFKTQYFHSQEYENDTLLGEAIGNTFDKEGLQHVLVFSEATHMNGSDLTSGLNHAFQGKVGISGGLAGDSSRFEKTLVGINGVQSDDLVVAIGLYGDSLEIGVGTEGGFETFGPWRMVTKSEKNVLHEIDGKPALSLYKEYLGDFANELPESALLFPLWLKTGDGEDDGLVRTILNIDEDNQHMTFAGNIPQGSEVRLMKTHQESLLSYAGDAAIQAQIGEPKTEGIALLVSCVGRKAILKNRSEEEVEEVQNIIGNSFKYFGFYSYGEISSRDTNQGCDLFNQSMTITTIKED